MHQPCPCIRRERHMVYIMQEKRGGAGGMVLVEEGESLRRAGAAGIVVRPTVPSPGARSAFIRYVQAGKNRRAEARPVSCRKKCHEVLRQKSRGRRKKKAAMRRVAARRRSYGSATPTEQGGRGECCGRFGAMREHEGRWCTARGGAAARERRPLCRLAR